MKKAVTVRFRIDFDGLCSIGWGKVELLEKISQCGSLSEAARHMDMSYRRAWLLVDSMNSSFDEPLVVASIGGRGGGGAVITTLGRQLIAAYRELELEMTRVAGRHLRAVVAHLPVVRAKPGKLGSGTGRRAAIPRMSGRRTKTAR